MDLILCHRTADFDTLGAAVGLARLQPGARIVLSGGAHPGVRSFLALYRDEYPLMERRSVQVDKIRAIAVVDTQRRELLGRAAEWLDIPGLAIAIYDHHIDAKRDIAATQIQVEAVGATTTLIAERLQQQQVSLTAAEATVMALGIHVDTGSLTFEHTTVRDAAALTWLIGQGANQRAIAEYIQSGLPENLQDLLKLGLEKLYTETVQGYKIASVLLTTEGYTPGMSTLASHLIDLTESDSLLLGNIYASRRTGTEKLTIIGRSRIEGVDLNALLAPLGGGGHAQAAAATLKTAEPAQILQPLLERLKQQIPHPPTAQELMSSPVRTIRPETTVDQARRILLRYGHSGLSVVDAEGQLLGIISRRDLDVALHHGFAHAPVKGYMTAPVQTIAPQTLLSEIESLMVTYDIGRLPVLEQGQLVGIVTRTDVLRQLYRLKQPSSEAIATIPPPLQTQLQSNLSSQLQELLQTAAQLATQQGWQLYLVGGAVRDLLLAGQQAANIREFDLVADGAQNLPPEGPGAVLAQSLQQHYPEAQLQIYGQFQTAALHWGTATPLAGFSVDIATARTEFYPYPAAHPEVTASSIRQDLYRRDFTINALAVRLTPPRAGELLDFFGGRMDLELRQIRVLHPNSFIEDPTRIFRAVRFAVRLGFSLDPQTETYIRHAIASGIYQRTQTEGNRTPSLQSRLKNELKAIFQLPPDPDFPGQAALKLLADLEAFVCIHPNFAPDQGLWERLAIAWQWFDQFGVNSTGIKAWEFLTEVLLADLSPSDRVSVAANLHLSQPSQARLEALVTVQGAIADHLQAAIQPSQISLILDKYDLPMLLLLATQVSPELRHLIWQYLDDWSQVKPPLDGNDLLRLGYKPGRQFRAILEHLRLAMLDGLMGTPESSSAEHRLLAEAFVQQHYSRDCE
jgi:tRNA nucleotidyltransferase (CCA-adding enzyme)